MFLKLISLLQVVIFIQGSDFNTLTNSDATASALQFSLISTIKRNSKLMCLSECTKRSDCLSAVYHKNDLNCFLFKDQLGSSDILASTSSNLYLKKSSKFR